MNNRLRKRLISIIIFLVLTTSLSRVCSINSLPSMTADLTFAADSSGVWSTSNITVALQNATITSSNLSYVELPAQINPTRSVIDTVRGFEPTQRFDSEFNSTLVDETRVGNRSLTRVDNGLLLFFNASSEQIAIARYELSFTNPKQISGNHSISVAFSTNSTYDSSQAYIGVSLLLRDLQGTRYYVSIQVSDNYPMDSFSLSKWFLGHTVDLTAESRDYPLYSMTYNSTFGPWFIQLPLSDSFAALGLSSAYLDGLFIGGEIYPRFPFNFTELDATFHYVLVHGLPFMINQETVNSTTMVLPPGPLRFSGITSGRVKIRVEGSLNPSYDNEIWLENETVKIRDALFNLSDTRMLHEILVEGSVKITVLSKTVKKCTLTLNNDTIVDLTDSLLDRNTMVFNFPEDTVLLEVRLVLCRFNAWFFSLLGFQPYRITKRGIVQEYFSTNESEGTISINLSETSPLNLAISSGNLIASEITVNGTKQSLERLLVLNRELYWTIPIVRSEEGISTYTVKYILSDEPLYKSLTTSPFSVYLDGRVFEILTPFSIEGQEGILVPLTVRTAYTHPKTYTLKIEYDLSTFKADKDEIMVYASGFRYYEYFMLTPLRTGQTTVNLRVVDPITMDTLFSAQFFVTIKSSFFTQVAIYFLLGATVVSLVYVFSKKSLLKLILRFRQQ